MPTISVLIPCHNAAPWLQEAITSIKNQTFRDIEIIVYDDGSTDESRIIIDHLAASDPRIIAMGQSFNCGIAFALNAMLRQASGAYIARMDGDDISLPRRLERQLNALKSGNTDLCGTWFEEFGEGISRSVRWHTNAEEIKAALLFQNTICHPTVMAKRELFETFYYRKDYELAEDYDLFARASSRFRLTNVPEILLRYRRHARQATQAKRESMEEVTQRIRAEALQAQGIKASKDQLRTHNLIRAPQSLTSVYDLESIEAWLLKLHDYFEHPDSKRVIVAQWTRAAIRAAPLGRTMWHRYRKSPLYRLLGSSLSQDLDLALLAATRLNYRSPLFKMLRRYGLSA